jgi:hypothetical protein
VPCCHIRDPGSHTTSYPTLHPHPNVRQCSTPWPKKTTGCHGNHPPPHTQNPCQMQATGTSSKPNSIRQQPFPVVRWQVYQQAVWHNPRPRTAFQSQYGQRQTNLQRQFDPHLDNIHTQNHCLVCRQLEVHRAPQPPPQNETSSLLDVALINNVTITIHALYRHIHCIVIGSRYIDLQDWCSASLSRYATNTGYWFLWYNKSQRAVAHWVNNTLPIQYRWYWEFSGQSHAFHMTWGYVTRYLCTWHSGGVKKGRPSGQLHEREK